MAEKQNTTAKKDILDEYSLGRVVFLEEPWWFFIFVILFFISAGAAVSLGLYGMYQWENGEVYSTDGLDIATYVCSSFALLFLLIIIIAYIVLSIDKSRRIDDSLLEKKASLLLAHSLAKRNYDLTKNEAPQVFRQRFEGYKNRMENAIQGELDQYKREGGNSNQFKEPVPSRQLSPQESAEEAATNPFSEAGKRNLELERSGFTNNSPISLSRPRRYNPPLKKKKPSPSSKKTKSPSKKKSPSSKKKVASSKRK
jgi:hypothetical protein